MASTQSPRPPATIRRPRHGLAEELRPVVLSNVYRYLGGRPAEEREDAAQDVFVKILRNLHRYDQQRASMTTWVACITRNHCLDVFRARRHAMTSLDAASPDDEFHNEPPASPQQDPLRCAQQTEFRTAFLEAASELPPTQREVIVLRHVDGLSCEMIARRLALRPATVKSRLHRAKRLMRERLRGWQVPED